MPSNDPANLAAISPSASSHETGSNCARPLRPRPAQRPRQTNVVVAENTVVGDRALRTQPAAADVMIRIATHMTNLAVTHSDQHTTGVVTVTRARRTNQTITRRPSHQSDSIAHEDHELPSLLRRRSVERLSASLRHEQRFAAELSHELGTPLAKIAAETELALRRERSGDDYRGSLESVHRNAEQMSRTVEALVSAARQEAGLSRSTSDLRMSSSRGSAWCRRTPTKGASRSASPFPSTQPVLARV